MFVSMAPSSKSVVSASGHLIPVSGIGQVQFRVFNYDNEHSSKVIIMENVWYVPSCTKNLVSVVQLFSKGFKIGSMNEGLSVISRSGLVVATARPRGGLFYFNTISSSNISGSFPGQSDIFLSENLQASH